MHDGGNQARIIHLRGVTGWYGVVVSVMIVVKTITLLLMEAQVHSSMNVMARTFFDVRFGRLSAVKFTQDASEYTNRFDVSRLPTLVI